MGAWGLAPIKFVEVMPLEHARLPHRIEIVFGIDIYAEKEEMILLSLLLLK